jgi:DNA-binding transcriptional MocR family regulator
MWVPDLDTLGGPIHARITEALAVDVASGRLGPGERLPAQRDLAGALGVAVATVTRAYAEARRRGLVSAGVGRGTFVRAAFHAPEGAAVTDLSVNSLPPWPMLGTLIASLGALGGPEAAESLFTYVPHEGLARYRAAGAAWLGTRELAASAEDVVVTAGAQHATLVVLATLARPRDVVLVEAHTYHGVKVLAEQLGVRLVGVPCDEDGVEPRALAAACKRHRPRAVYLMPSFQNPTGVTMGGARRRAIARIVAAADVPLIEDDVYGFLGEEPPIAAHAPRATFHVTSLSKSFVSGIRVGYVRAPEGWATRLGPALFASVVVASPFAAELASRWIADGTAARVAAWKREEVAARQILARRVFGHPAPDPASPHLWLRLPERLSAEDFVVRARLRGVFVTAGSVFTVAPASPTNAVRVCLGPPATRDALERALATLADLLTSPATQSTTV